MPPLALVGGRVRATPCGREHEAIAFHEGVLVAVGTRSDVLAEAGPHAQVIDVGGASILPGFIDAHHHIAIAALYGGAVQLAAPAVHDIATLQSALSRYASTLAPGRWLVAMNWDETQLRERRPPNRAELDAAVPDHPLFALHYSCHRALANSRALTLSSIDRHTPQPSGGVISTGRGGEPDGLLIERGMSRAEALARPNLVSHDAASILARIAAHYRRLVAVGITRVVDAAVPSELWALYQESARRGDVLLPTHVCPVSTRGYLEEPTDVLGGPPTGHREGPLTVGPVKLVFDGAPACSMCLSWWQVLGSSLQTFSLAMRTGSWDPVRTSLSIQPRFGRQVRSGIAIYARHDAARVVRSVVDRGFAVASHAMGNEAIDVAVSAYAAAGMSLHRGGVPRIEHATFLDRTLVQRLADGGMAAVVQPAMLRMHALATAPNIDGLPFEPLRWLRDAGVKVVGSSDYPVVDFDPLEAMRAAMQRTNARGRSIGPEQALRLDEALDLYTKSAAEVIGCDDRAGTLEVGKRADLVVVDGFEGQLERAAVRSTYVAGELLFARDATQ